MKDGPPHLNTPKWPSVKTLLKNDEVFEGLARKQRKELMALFQQLHPESGEVWPHSIARRLHELGLDPKDAEISKETAQLFSTFNSISFTKFVDFINAAEANETPTLLYRALTGKVALPWFQPFVQDITTLFEECRAINDGKVGDDIPELATVDPDLYAFSICSVDGQESSYGDHEEEFCLQSCTTPFTYSMACEELGSPQVMKYVGCEPSGTRFNAFTLNHEQKPHNPMTNSGAMMVCSLMHRNLSAARRIAAVIDILAEASGGGKITFSQPAFLSERDTGDRNFALAHFMKSQGAFPEDITSEGLTNVLDFYFQTCSITTTTRWLSRCAATLANGGVCPQTGKRIFTQEVVRNTLQIMLSCGMHDFSGEWAVKIGLPAKSGISGVIMVVVPKVMGIAVYSPRLDSRGNSVRGIQFLRKVVDKYSLSLFDQLLPGVVNKIDPTVRNAGLAPVATVEAKDSDNEGEDEQQAQHSDAGDSIGVLMSNMRQH